MKCFLLVGLGLAALFQCNLAQAGEIVSGRPLVLEGDTLVVRGKVVGLFGVAAPGPSQTCYDSGGGKFGCGAVALQALIDRIGEGTVTCETRGTDRSRRILAVCRLGETDLGAWLVSNGLAVADRLRATDYVGDDKKAWAKRRGLWAGVFEDPSERVRDDYSAAIKLTGLGR